VSRDEAELFTLAARRTEWASIALHAAAAELLRASEQGAVVGQVPGHLQGEAGRLKGFVRMIERAREQSTTTRRPRV
jgi:hypothetical protein